MTKIAPKFFLIMWVVLFLSSKNAFSASFPVWQGDIDNVPTWITVVSSELTTPDSEIEREAWWTWGNTETDTYIFAFHTPDNVQMILSFRENSEKLPVAEIYVAQNESEPLQYSFQNNELIVHTNSDYPFVTIVPRDVGWLIGENTNYNLDLFFDGVYLPGWGYSGAKTDGVIDAHSRVGSEILGIPSWEILQLEYDPRPLDGYPRLGILQRMSDAPPFKVAPGILPGFPYLGIGWQASNWFTQNPNPLFFNLQRMTLETNPFPGFQNGGMHNVNSLNFAPDINFEAPFVFYNFDQNSRQTQMVVRGAFFPVNDPHVPFRTDYGQAGYRYSWKTDSDVYWAYGLQMAGMRNYEDWVTVGDLQFRSVPPEIFPEWVVNHDWPLVTFIEPRPGYGGSEGIYFYSGQDQELWAWLAGETNTPPTNLKYPYLQQNTDLTAFTDTTLPEGFRGEYLFLATESPSLYLSPIDYKLHLLGAQGGVWNLGDGHILRTHNLDTGKYINVWIRETISLDVNEHGLGEIVESQLIEALYVLPNYLLHITPQGFSLRQAHFEPSLFEIAPPTNKATWQAFREQVRQYENQERDPVNLHGWLDAFSGPRMDMVGASIANVRFLDDGFRFELTLTSDYQTYSDDLLGIAGLAAGDYLVVHRQGEFAISPLVSAILSLDMQPLEESETTTTIQIKVQNRSTADAPALMLVAETVAEGETMVELSRVPVDALAGESVQLLLNIPPEASGAVTLRLRLEDTAGQTVATAEQTRLVDSARDHDAIFSIWQVPILLLVLSLFGAFMTGVAVLAITRRREQSTL